MVAPLLLEVSKSRTDSAPMDDNDDQSPSGGGDEQTDLRKTLASGS